VEYCTSQTRLKKPARDKHSGINDKGRNAYILTPILNYTEFFFITHFGDVGVLLAFSGYSKIFGAHPQSGAHGRDRLG
jgi:hypothetical protein